MQAVRAFALAVFHSAISQRFKQNLATSSQIIRIEQDDYRKSDADGNTGKSRKIIRKARAIQRGKHTSDTKHGIKSRLLVLPFCGKIRSLLPYISACFDRHKHQTRLLHQKRNRPTKHKRQS